MGFLVLVFLLAVLAYESELISLFEYLILARNYVKNAKIYGRKMKVAMLLPMFAKAVTKRILVT